MKQYKNTLAPSTLGNTTLFTNITSSGKRYFSGIDAELYFGDTYIDDIVQWQFQLQQNVMPIVGYNSYVYDDIAVGSRIISGQFAVNYTKSNYLVEVLSALKGKSVKKYGISVNTDSASTLYPMNASSTYSQNKGALWNCNFEMVVSYGGNKNDNNPDQQLLVIGGVQITGVSQQYDASGQPIIEVYSFIARDIEPLPTATTKAAATKTGAMAEAKVITISSATYVKTTGNGASNETISGVFNFKYTLGEGITITKVSMRPKLKKNVSQPYISIPLNKGSFTTYTVSKSLAHDIDVFFGTTDKGNYNGTAFDVEMIIYYKTKSTTKEVSKSITQKVTLQRKTK